MVSLNGTLLVQFVNFFLLVVLLRMFAYKPLLAIMNERKQRIANDLSSAEEARIASEALLAKYQQMQKDANVKAEAIISEAEKNAEQLAQAHLSELREQLAREKSIAHKEISLERERILSEIRSEVVVISMAVAEQVLRRELSAAVEDSYIDDAIARLGSKSVGLQ